MVKLKRLNVYTVDPSVNKQKQVEFSFSDCYLRKSKIAGLGILDMADMPIDTWKDLAVKSYCKEHNLKLCNVYTLDAVPHFTNIVVDNTIENLINELD